MTKECHCLLIWVIILLLWEVDAKKLEHSFLRLNFVHGREYTTQITSPLRHWTTFFDIKSNSRIFWSACSGLYEHVSFSARLSPVRCLDFQSCFLQHRSPRGLHVFPFFQARGPTPLASIWGRGSQQRHLVEDLLPLRNSFLDPSGAQWGRPAPTQGWWSPAVLTGGLRTFYWWERAALQVDYAQLLNVCSFQRFWSTPAGSVAVASPISVLFFLSLLLSPYIYIYLSPTFHLLLWPFWNTG